MFIIRAPTPMTNARWFSSAVAKLAYASAMGAFTGLVYYLASGLDEGRGSAIHGLVFGLTWMLVKIGAHFRRMRTGYFCELQFDRRERRAIQRYRRGWKAVQIERSLTDLTGVEVSEEQARVKGAQITFVFDPSSRNEAGEAGSSKLPPEKRSHRLCLAGLEEDNLSKLWWGLRSFLEEEAGPSVFRDDRSEKSQERMPLV